MQASLRPHAEPTIAQGPTLLQELRSSALLFAMAIGTTVGTVLATRLLLRVLG